MTRTDPAFSRPVADEVRNPDGGAAYVKLNAALIGHPKFPLLSPRATSNPTADRLLRLVAKAAPSLPEPLLGPRMLLVTGLVFHGVADGASLARSRAGREGEEWELFVRHLVDCVVSLFEAPVSADTRAGLPGKARRGFDAYRCGRQGGRARSGSARRR